MFGSRRQSVSVVIADPTADEKQVIFVAPSDRNITIEKATFFIAGGVSASTVNYVECSLENGGTAGTATTDLGGTAGGTAGWTDNVPQSFSPAQGSGKLTAGQVLVLDYAETGTVAPARITAVIEYVDGVGDRAAS